MGKRIFAILTLAFFCHFSTLAFAQSATPPIPPGATVTSTETRELTQLEHDLFIAASQFRLLYHKCKNERDVLQYENEELVNVIHALPELSTPPPEDSISTSLLFGSGGIVIGALSVIALVLLTSPD